MNVQEGYMLKKIMMILVATNVVASRPPDRRPTETPTACAKSREKELEGIKRVKQGMSMLRKRRYTKLPTVPQPKNFSQTYYLFISIIKIKTCS